MGNKKRIVNRYQVSTNEAQEKALKKLMADDMQENVSQYFGMMIAEITRNRINNQRRPVGRPRKGESDEIK